MIEIDLESLRDRMPDAIKGDRDAEQRWIEALYEQIRVAYAALEPDGAHIHPSFVRAYAPTERPDDAT